MQKDHDSFRVETEFGLEQLVGLTPIVIPAIPLTNNGNLVDPSIDISAPMILFDDFMHVEYGTELYGADINYMRGVIRHNAPMRIELTAGARYIRLHEELLVTGNDLRNQIQPTILSASSNHIFGPSVGVRAEWEYGLLKLGADSRFTAAFNRNNNYVRTDNLFLQNQLPTKSDDDHTDFSPVHELQLYAQVKLTHRCKLRVGYDLLTLFEVSRPHNQVIWDDSGVVDGPVRIRAGADHQETFNAHGIVVSGEISLY